MTEYEHPDHGQIVEHEWELRGEKRQSLKCERCNHLVPRDRPEQFDEVDCDHFKDVSDAISGNLK